MYFSQEYIPEHFISYVTQELLSRSPEAFIESLRWKPFPTQILSLLPQESPMLLSALYRRYRFTK